MFYKNDQDRFSQKITLKLKTFYLYDVVVEVNEDQKLSHVTLGGKKYNAFRTMDNPDNATRVYKFVWSTGNIRTTRRSHRSVLPCVVKFSGYQEVAFDLLVKFYYKEETVRYTGIPLSLIDLQVSVGKETVINNISFE